ncbi:hypothetical protein IJ579_06085 [bacterium]|nr:hypothetical protein [bacterium]
MGLSAAQARLLTITARKSDCEFQSMSLSHQKIALSRDMQNITEAYQNSLNKTKLVYDYFGTGTSDMALSYSLLMTPSLYNDFYPKTLTDSTNKVVLNTAFADAVRAAGIPMEGFGSTSSSYMRDCFIQALADQGILTASEVKSIEAVQYDNAAGLGYDFESSVAIEDITYDEFMDQLKTYETDLKSYGLYLGGFYTLYNNDPADWKLLSARDRFNPNATTYSQWSDFTYNLQSEQGKSPYSAYGVDVGTGVYVKKSGNNSYEALATDHDDDAMQFSNPNPAKIKLSDLLENKDKYTFIIDTRNNEGIVNDTAYLQRLMFGSDNNELSFVSWMEEQIVSILGDTDTTYLALEYARSNLLDLIWPNDNAQYAASATDTGSAAVPTMYNKYVQEICGTDAYYTTSDNSNEYLINQAENYMGLYVNTGSGISINLNNIARMFFTSFVEFTQGIDDSNYTYGPGSISDCRMFSPYTDTDVVFEQLIGADAETGANKTTAEFYDTLFNLICTQGWVENSRIDDADYMQDMIRSGMVYISTINETGSYNQENYTADKYISEVLDTEAIAQAEAKYHAEKARIENKENTLDLKMKNLDTEISALTQEYDTAKSLISKNIDKSFKRYEA